MDSASLPHKDMVRIHTLKTMRCSDDMVMGDRYGSGERGLGPNFPLNLAEVPELSVRGLPQSTAQSSSEKDKCLLKI